MRHLVLAIAAIAVAQIAFQLYIVDDPRPEYSASVASAAWPVDTILTARGDLNAEPNSRARPPAARVKYRRPEERRLPPVRAAYRRSAPRARTTLTARAPKRVARPDGPMADDDGDGKHWIAKALPIVKKPYDWLKALGSKLK